MTSRARLLAAVSLGAALFLSYVPDSGHGFLKDDFRWIVESRVRAAGDLARLFLSDNGFYRPVVSLSFAANEWLFGAWPRGYALTSFAILLLCCGALFALARALKMEPGVALLAVGLWALNPHGISGLVMWISGRTSGLVTLFSLLTALAFVTGRRLLAAGLCFVALLSKEEAFFLPLVLTAWAGWSPRSLRWDWREALKRGWPLVVMLAPYMLLRSQTEAYLPTTAPSYYRFVSSPLLLGQNILQYADRAATFTAAVLLLLFVAVRRLRRLEGEERYWIALGAAWLVGGFGLSVFVPARSSLYVCLPSVGVALIGATLARCLWSRATERTRVRVTVIAVLVPLLLVPLLHSRNRRARAAADLSTVVLGQLETVTSNMRPGSTLVLEDDRAERPNLREAFGSLLEPALMLRASGVSRVDYLPPGDGWTEIRVQCGDDSTAAPARFRLSQGRLVPID